MEGRKTALTLLVGALLVCAAVATAASVVPETVNPWSPAGGAAGECAAAGCNAKYAFKIEPWDNPYVSPSGEYYHEESGNTITITAYGESGKYTSFDWQSNYPVCCVIVKGGTGANIFRYPAGTYEDRGLYAPVNPRNGKNYAVSHVTFCFNDPPRCWKPETAWAYGPRYVDRGNWATYVPYHGSEKTVEIYAGQTLYAGTAAFSAPDANGWVTITITLGNEFVFWAPPDSIGYENIKVQDYASAPSGNPSPGLFQWKSSAEFGATVATIVVPQNNFYGVHLDVAYPCP